MNSEIKEILDNLEKLAKVEYLPDDLLTYKECQLLLDYITNLQQKEHKANCKFQSIKGNCKELGKKNENQRKELASLNDRLKEVKKANGFLKQERNKMACLVNDLQEKIDQYENPDDLTLFYMWLDEKAKDKMKEQHEEIKNLRDTLTNLQQENERLKELCNKYEEEHSTAFKLWKTKLEELPCYDEMLVYKSRCEKVIEYIKGHQRKDEFLNLNEWETRDLLNILNGDDNK